jgi:hypothetical protein
MAAEAPEVLDVPEGVKAFNFWTIWIMARLWEEFPRPQFFNASREVIYATSDQRHAGVQISSADLPPAQLFGPTLDWLLSEGFVKGKANGAGMYAMVGLTTKGFSVLNQVPRSISPKPSEPDKPLGALIRKAVADHAVDAAATLIQKMLLPG